MNGFFKPTDRPKVLGHRGTPKLYQENTLAGFRKAHDLGAHGVELDVFMTRDEKLVVFHDEDPYRLTGVKGNITEMSWDEISKLRIGKTIDRGDGTLINYPSEQPIPLLEEVLYELPSDFLINIEMKAYSPQFSRRHTGTKVAEIIEKTQSFDRTIVTSFDFFMIEYLERACPEIHSGFTYDDGMLDGFDQWLKKFPLLIDQAVPDSDSLSFLNFILESNVIGHFINSTVVGAEHTLIDEDTVEKFHQRGMLAGAYTLFPEDKRYLNGTTRNSESEAIRLAAAGIDWIETDHPERLLEILELSGHNDSQPDDHLNNVV